MKVKNVCQQLYSPSFLPPPQVVRKGRQEENSRKEMRRVGNECNIHFHPQLPHILLDLYMKKCNATGIKKSGHELRRSLRYQINLGNLEKHKILAQKMQCALRRPCPKFGEEEKERERKEKGIKEKRRGRWQGVRGEGEWIGGEEEGGCKKNYLHFGQD